MSRSPDAAAHLVLKARNCRRLAESAKLPEVARSLLELARELEAGAAAARPPDGKEAAD
jgi:hypothetical protein